MGTSQSPDAQWIELYNASHEPVSLDGWKLVSSDGSLSNQLDGRIAPEEILLLSTQNSDRLAGVPVHQHVTGSLPAEDTILRLYDDAGHLMDAVDRWYAGDPDKAATMQRVYPYTAGSQSSSWTTATIRYDYGYGTPGFRQPPSYTDQALHQVYHEEGSINVFFNQPALTELAKGDNYANHRINLEERIIERLRQARHRIDLALYEINLPVIIDVLMDKAEQGVDIRLLIDAKAPSNGERNKRYRLMRLCLERMLRGRDGHLGTSDSIHIFANSPIFAVTDPEDREAFGLPPNPAVDLKQQRLKVGDVQREGYLLVSGAEVAPNDFYGPGGQMHNKFALIDDYRLLTGSMNFTETGVYGSERNRLANIPDGNSNHLIDIHSPQLVDIYRDEFNMMWGAATLTPSSRHARFRSEKPQGQKGHYVRLGDTDVQVYFSPGYDVVRAITDFVEREADASVYFAIFAWSDSALENTLKRKWEGSGADNRGQLTGFRVKGVFERLFWNQWWSANLNMLGRTAAHRSPENPNIKWRHPPPIYRDRESRKLHHKYMVIDADTPSNPTVITGSANWSRNANERNDENTLFIHDPRIANQFVQEFYARYQQAGGAVISDSDLAFRISSQ